MSEPIYQCEQCGDDVPESEAATDTHPGARGHTVTLAFCPACSDSGVGA